MNFGSLVSGAGNYLSGAAKGIGNAVSGGFNGLVKGAQNFLGLNHPGGVPQAQAQTPTAPIVNQNPSPIGRISQPAAPRPLAQVPSLANTTTTTAPAYNPSQVFQQNYAPVAQAESSLSNYLASRDPGQYLQQEFQSLGIPDLTKAVSNETQDLLTQQNNINTLPAADIARRSDNGMLSAAQRNALTASEQAPMRQQLLQSEQANAGDTAKLNSLVSLANNYLGAYNQGTSAGASGYQTQIGDATAAYNAAQAAAQNEAQANAIKSTTTAPEAQQAQMTTLANNAAQEVKQGATLNQVMSKYLAQGLDPNTILSLYNANSTFGPAKESGAQLTSRYGVASGRAA
jgi:hypothetical protein